MISLIIDTNIVFSAYYNPKGLERRILDTILKKDQIQSFAPDIFFEELFRNFEEKLGYSRTQLLKIFQELEIIKVEYKEYKKLIPAAEKLIVHKNDVPFLAVALLKKCPIWSGNVNHFKHLRNSEKITWFNSRRLLDYLQENNMIEYK